MGWSQGGRAGQLLAELLGLSSLCVEEQQLELDKVLVSWCLCGRSLLLWQLLLQPTGLLPHLIGRCLCGKGPDLTYIWEPSQEHPLSSFWFKSLQSQWDLDTNLECCWRLLSWWKGFLVSQVHFLLRFEPIFGCDDCLAQGSVGVLFRLVLMLFSGCLVLNILYFPRKWNIVRLCGLFNSKLSVFFLMIWYDLF